ncbi:MAG: hypothetical protein LBV23_03550, partial [Deltaproteobacteria bacterium]|nr:hypothetical protein [Deltaproteobacteria bacterium]
MHYFGIGGEDIKNIINADYDSISHGYKPTENGSPSSLEDGGSGGRGGDAAYLTYITNIDSIRVIGGNGGFGGLGYSKDDVHLFGGAGGEGGEAFLQTGNALTVNSNVLVQGGSGGKNGEGLFGGDGGKGGDASFTFGLLTIYGDLDIISGRKLGDDDTYAKSGKVSFIGDPYGNELRAKNINFTQFDGDLFFTVKNLLVDAFDTTIKFNSAITSTNIESQYPPVYIETVKLGDNNLTIETSMIELLDQLATIRTLELKGSGSFFENTGLVQVYYFKINGGRINQNNWGNLIGETIDEFKKKYTQEYITIGPLGAFFDIEENTDKKLSVSLYGINGCEEYEECGGLFKNRNGQLTLLGFNFYQGQTQVGSGTLKISGVLGANDQIDLDSLPDFNHGFGNGYNYRGNIFIGPGARLEFSQQLDGEPKNQLLSGSLSGEGSLVKSNNFNLLLSGSIEAFTGPIIVKGGSLIMPHGGKISNSLTLEHNTKFYASGNIEIKKLNVAGKSTFEGNLNIKDGIMNFFIIDGLEIEGPMLEVNGRADITDAEVYFAIESTETVPKEGESISLMKVKGELTGTPIENPDEPSDEIKAMLQSGVSLQYVFDIKIEDNQLLAYRKSTPSEETNGGNGEGGGGSNNNGHGSTTPGQGSNDNNQGLTDNGQDSNDNRQGASDADQGSNDNTQAIADAGGASNGSSSGAKLNVQTKALSEGFIAGIGLVNMGADLVAGQGMAEAVLAAHRAGADKGKLRGGLGAFGALSGGRSRYNTGSHVDMNGISLMVGLSWGADLSPGRLTLGAFFEYGNGTYDTYNSFVSAASVHGNGDIRNLGGGLLARMDFDKTGPGRFYADFSARAGGVRNQYGNSDLVDLWGRQAAYESSSAYYGFHFGTGYLWNISDTASLDLYAKYFATVQKGDSVILTTGDPVTFNDATSSRLRLGARIGFAVNDYVRPYIGAAWEREFNGES